MGMGFAVQAGELEEHKLNRRVVTKHLGVLLGSQQVGIRTNRRF